MLDIVLVASGIVTMCFAVFLNFRLLKLLEDRNVKSKWTWLLCFIIFFLLGYVGFLGSLIFPQEHSMITSLLVAAVFFFGAVFVVAVLLIDISMVKNLLSKNKELSDVTRALMSSNKNLIEAENELQLKNEDLKGTLDKARITIGRKERKKTIRRR